MKAQVAFCLLAASCCTSAMAQSDSLEACIEDGAFCSEGEPLTFDNPCGPDFYFFRGRVSWAPLRNTGPVTISVWTHSSALPLYVKVAPITAGYPDTTCVTYFPGAVVFAAHGAPQCEGVWEVIGPLSLDLYVRPGAAYALILEGFETPPVPPGGQPYRSAAVRCVRVIPHRRSTVLSTPWPKVKILYGGASR